MNISFIINSLAPLSGANSLALLQNQALPFLLAQISSAPIDASVRSFLDFAQKLLVLPTLALAVNAAWCFHEGKIREGVLSLVGAFLCSVAVPIVKAIFGF